ncbi:MAG TPA: DUF4845 domain-containing protein [Spongiibacteraceae bacterium]|nr:DUF4845 domain-containing protein [Spongiibacteraceae bacterium]
MRKYQTGLGALGWLIVLGIGSFFLTCFFKVGPVYLEYWQTKKALDDVMSAPQSAVMAKSELLDSIQKHLDVSLIESIKSKDIRVADVRNGRELDASYEKRVALISNIDVVVKFDKLKYNLAAPQ